jgi:hypothetical protein
VKLIPKVLKSVEKQLFTVIILPAVEIMQDEVVKLAVANVGLTKVICDGN